MYDLRIALPAGVAWLSAAVVVSCATVDVSPIARHGAALRWTLIVGLVALIAMGAGLLGRRGPVALAAAGLLVGAASAGLQLTALTADPVRTWVDRGSLATVTGVVVTEPVARSRPSAAVWQSGSLTEFTLATSTMEVRGQAVAVDVPFLVRGSAPVALDPGTWIRLTGHLGRARAPDIAGVLHLDAHGGVQVIADAGALDAIASSMRHGLRTALEGRPPDAAALVAGLSVGDERLQSPDLADAMRASGLSHLTAVSGGNVAIILVVVLAATRFLRLGLPMRIGIALAAIGFFVILVRPQPSVVRAAVMGVVMLLALATGGRQRSLGVLATAVLLIVVWSPLLAASWAFALSTFATVGLIVLAPPLIERLGRWHATRRWPPALAEGAAITIAAQLATAPILIAMGASFGWVAVPANLLAAPAVAPVTILGLLAACATPVPMLAALLAVVASWPAAWIAVVARTTSTWPFATLPWPSGVVGVVLLAAALVTVVAVRRLLRAHYPQGTPRSVIAAIIAPVVAIAVLLVLLPPGRRGWPPPGWQLIACDVGQGDGLVARVADGTALVIDTGPDPRAMRRCLDDLGVRAISAVILTHFHADHVNGLPGILDRPVGAVYVTAVDDPADEVRLVDGWLRTHDLGAVVVHPGEVLRSGDATWRVLWPRRIITRGSIPNQASVVIALDLAGTTVLLPGDVEAEAQAAIIAQEPALHVDVMKVPHHGSRNQDPRLPQWSAARIALISCGTGNPYGHPNAQTVDAWRGHGALIGRTDLEGDLAVIRTPEGALGLVARGT